MNQGKAKVIGEVIKQQGMFKAITIVTATGLGRSLVHHHVMNLVADGYLEKDGMKYGVVARQDLIDNLVGIGENNVTGLFPAPDVFKRKEINEYIELAIMLRAARVNGAEAMRNAIAQTLDTEIQQCKGAKRYLNSKTVSERKALKKLYENFDELWPKIGEVVKVDKNMMYEAIAGRLEDA